MIGTKELHPVINWLRNGCDPLKAADELELIAAAPNGAQPVQSVPEGWKQLVQELVREVERKTCTHEETHRGGFLWEICNSCGAKWADDQGGKQEFVWPEVVEKAREFLATAPEAKP